MSRHRYWISCGYCTTGELGMKHRGDRHDAIAAAGWAILPNTADGSDYYACPRCANKLQGNTIDHEGQR